MPLNQIEIDDYNDTYYCADCDRDFNTEGGLLQHCRTARCHASTWCNRCEVLFVDSQAMNQHIRDSPNHNICNLPGCYNDFAWASDYNQHFKDEHDGCWRCGFYNIFNLEDHLVKKHNMCSQCDEFYSSDNALKMHLKVHLPHDKECYGCDRTFGSHSAILIHLEAGNCGSGIDEQDIKDIAWDFYASDEYMNGYDDYYCFRCPTCEMEFRFVSGLFQHVESRACEEFYDYYSSIGGLRDEIERRILPQACS